MITNQQIAVALCEAQEHARMAPSLAHATVRRLCRQHEALVRYHGFTGEEAARALVATIGQ